MLSKGVLQADLFIHHPMVEYYLKAVRCCLLECEGFQSGFGHALTQTSNGFIGLEDIKFDHYVLLWRWRKKESYIV